MKKACLFFLLTPFFANAQKSVDLDKFRFRVQYRSLPAVRIDSSYRTYHVNVSTTKLMEPFFQGMSPGKSLHIEGLKRLENNGHLQVEVKLGDLLPGDVSVKERVVTTRNGNGVITGTKTYYYQEVVYTFEAEAIITDYKGMHIMEQQPGNRNYKHIYRSPEFTLRAMAEGYFILNSLALTKELYREQVTNTFKNLSVELTNSFGYEAVTVNDNMWVIDSRKHAEHAAWRNAVQQIYNALFDMTADKPITGVKEQLKPAIEYFEKIKRTYASGSRHDRKVRYGSYYNLAVLYYYLDDPQAMAKEAGGLILNDFETKDGKAFENTATWLKNLFAQNNIYTRHFEININSLKGPAETNNTTAGVNQ